MKPLSKGLLLLATFGLLAVSCMKEPAQEPEAQMTDMPSITAVTLAESPATRVSVGPAVDGKRPIVWNTGDALSVFFKNSMNVKYVLKGEGGEPEGVFAYASGLSFGYEFPQVYGAYPYDEKVKLEDGCLWVTIPAEQSYTEKTFDPKANAMVGVSDPGKEMPFRNVGGYLVLQFYGEDAEVKEVKVTGAMAEQIAGTVLMGVEEDEIPWLVDWGDGASDEVKLVAETPVKVGATAEEATEFWLVLMPVTFMDGLTVTVTDADGNLLLSQTKDSAVEIKRSEVYRLDPLCLSHSNGAFAASVTWTYADDADVDHNLFYGSEGTTRYSREALPLGVDASIVTKYGEEIAAATPEGVTVTVADPETGDTVPADDVTVSNITLKDGDLVADVEGFLWDKVYGVSVEYALSGSELTLDGSLTTVDRKREPVTLDLVAEYTFDINKLDSETGFGYIEKEPVKDSWYKWESEPLTDAIYAAYLNGGVITKDDFANADEFFKEEVEDEVRAAPSSGSAKEFVTVSRETACPSTTTDFKASVLKGEVCSSGKADPDDPYRIVGNDLDRRITTYIGQEVIIPIRLSYRVPKYDFLHQQNYTFDDGKWYTMDSPKYSPNKQSLKEYDVVNMNVPALTFNVIDENKRFFNYLDEELEPEYFYDKNLTIRFDYTDPDLAAQALEDPCQTTELKTFGDLWSDKYTEEKEARNFKHAAFYYRSLRDAIPMTGTLEVSSGDAVFEIPTSFEKDNGGKYLAKKDYSKFELRAWKPFYVLDYNPEITVRVDEHKIYVVNPLEGVQIYDGRQVAASTPVAGEEFKGGEGVYMIEGFNGGTKSYFRPMLELISSDGSSEPVWDWIHGNGSNGYSDGITSFQAYSLSDPVFATDIPTGLSKLISFEDNLLKFDYTSEVQISGTINIPVTIEIQSPWYQFEPFKVTVLIKGYDTP